MRVKATIDTLEPRLLLVNIASGVTVAGTISGSQENTYTFTAQGSHEVIAVAGESNATAFTPRIDLLNSDNTVIKSATGTIQAYLRFNIATSGTYTLRVRDASSSSGSYKLTMFTAGQQGTETDDSTGAIASGRRIVASAGPGDLDIYRVNLTSGQILNAVATENTAGNGLQLGMDIVAPNGSYVIGQTDPKGVGLEVSTSQTGTYYVIVRATSQVTGNYGYSHARVPGSQYTSETDYGQLTSGVIRNGELLRGDVDLFYFYVEPGTSINTSVSSRNGSSVDPYLMLCLPSGELLASAEDSISETSTYGGTYWLVVRDFEADDAGQYKVTLELGSGNGSSPGSTIHFMGTSNAEVITATITNNVLSIVNGNTTKSYYAPEFSQLNIDARAGNDLVDVSTLSIRTYLFGGDGDDTLKGGSGRDTLTAGAGKNYLYGGAGFDRLNCSGGRDSLYGQAGNDRLYGNGGDDYLDGGGNIDRLFGGSGNDTLIGGGSNDKLYGEDGNDRLIGNAGHDILDGAAGTDTAKAEDDDSLVNIETII